MTFFKFLILGISISAFIYICTELYKKHKTTQKFQNKMNRIPELNIDLNNAAPTDLEKLKLQELKKIYIQLIDVETKIEETNKRIDDTNSSINIIIAILIIPIIICIVCIIFNINLLQDIFQMM